MDQSRSIPNLSQFIRSISEKNYAAANKYLRAELDDKMKDRIRNIVAKEEHEPEMDSAEDHQQYLAGKEDAKKAKAEHKGKSKKSKKGKKKPKFGKDSEHQDFVERQAKDQS